jgi:hypothetical protein
MSADPVVTLAKENAPDSPHRLKHGFKHLIPFYRRDFTFYPGAERAHFPAILLLLRTDEEITAS